MGPRGREMWVLGGGIFLLGLIQLSAGAHSHPGMCPPDMPPGTPCDDNCQADDNCPAQEKCCWSGCSSRCSPIIEINEASYPAACPMPMCANRCPVGQDYGVDSRGCMTCTCVEDTEEDNSVNQPELRDIQQVETQTHPECEGDEVWQECGSPCTPMCNQTTPRCIRRCQPRCACPFDKPVLHEGHCVTAEYCKEHCPVGQVWTECGTECTPTCWDRSPTPCPGVCMPRCSCPPERPFWDEVMKRCSDALRCPMAEEESQKGEQENKVKRLLKDLQELEALVSET